MKTTPEKLAYDREWRAANRDWQKAYDQRLTPEQKAAHQKAKEERFNKFKNEFVGPMPRGRAFYGKSSHLKARQRAYIDANPDEFQGPPRSLRSTNAPKSEGEKAEVKRAARRRHHQKNKHKARAKDARREAAKAQRTPVWFGEFDQFVFTEAYALLPLREEATGIAWHVDHMIPLRAKEASGLHVGVNAAVIPGVLNVSKAEKMILTETGDWLRL